MQIFEKSLQQYVFQAPSNNIVVEICNIFIFIKIIAFLFLHQQIRHREKLKNHIIHIIVSSGYF